MKAKVMGWKHSKGQVDSFAYDFVTIYIIARLPAADNQRGYAGIEMKGEPYLVEKLQKIEFQGVIECNLETETIAKGKGQFEERVVSITPVQKAAA